jgi:RNA polymerase sigma-70 factor, ECF subfamily
VSPVVQTQRSVPALRMTPTGADPSAAIDLSLLSPSARRQQILSGTARHETWAIAAFYDAYAERVNRLVWRLLGDRQDHDDVVGQVFVQLLASLDGLKDPDALDAWVTVVATNTVRQEIRSRQSRRRIALVPDIPEDHSDSSPMDDIPTRLWQGTLARQFYGALDRLGVEERVVFALHYVEGMSLAESAAACSCSTATVKRRLGRARDQFVQLAKLDPVLACAMEEITSHGS